MIRPPDVSREGPKFYPWTFFISFLSIHRAQQPRSGQPSNVFRRFGSRQSFNNWYRDLGHPSPNFHRGGGQKVRNLASFSTSLNFEPLAFENAARYLNAETNFLCRNDRPMFSSSLVKLVPRTLRTVCQSCPPIKLHSKNVLNRQ